jgi:uncharacterized protein (TIGR01777 family)
VKIAVTGASGFLGSALVPALTGDGHDVRRLVRRDARSAEEISWRPEVGYVDLDALAGTAAVVHLAGVGIGDRPWTPAHKRAVMDSRVQGTRTIATAVAGLDPQPRVLLSAAGSDVYGVRGDEVLDESSPPGDGYVAEVVQAWEANTAPAADAGVRVVTMRTGVVVSGKGGAFGRRLLPLFRLGLGGRVGSGRQWWSWVSRTDYVRAVQFLLARDDLHGPVNVCAPEPVRNADLTRTMGRVLGRPTLTVAPGFALTAVLGDFGRGLVGGARVLPTRLLDAGFTFHHQDFETALRAELARSG